MDPASVGTAAKLLGELAKALPFNSPAKRQIEMLNEQIKLLDRHISSLERANAGLTKQLADVTKDLAELQERYASDQLATEEFEEAGYIYRRTPDGGKTGPYCPNHRDVYLVPVGGHRYCPKCKVPIGRG
jgi:hypothetical protein